MKWIRMSLAMFIYVFGITYMNLYIGKQTFDKNDWLKQNTIPPEEEQEFINKIWKTYYWLYEEHCDKQWKLKLAHNNTKWWIM
jgi:hypothetical protein